MTTTHNEAIEHLIRTGNVSDAFAIALRDEGINPEVTIDQWLSFAEDCIARRAVEASRRQPEFN